MLWEKYFSDRNVARDHYKSYYLPPFLKDIIPGKQSRILDIGCGLGQDLKALMDNGYHNAWGVDVSDEAINHCQSQKLPVYKIESLDSLGRNNHLGKFDVVLMSHVLEHLSKNEVIPTLKLIREQVLNEYGILIIRVPNAQSNTGCYWAYEDFTHETLFTAGSIEFVLKASGFKNIEFIDIDGLNDTKWYFKFLRKMLLVIYKLNFKFWNKVTASSFHQPSRISFAYELKVAAKNSL